MNLAGSLGYVRTVITPSFSGGTSPNVAVCGLVILGGANELAAV